MLKKRSKEFEVLRNLFGLYHLSQVIERKAQLTAQFTEEIAQRRRSVDVSQRRFEEEEMELESRQRILTSDFKSLMKANKLFPKGLNST